MWTGVGEFERKVQGSVAERFKAAVLKFAFSRPVPSQAMPVGPGNQARIGKVVPSRPVPALAVG